MGRQEHWLYRFAQDMVPNDQRKVEDFEKLASLYADSAASLRDLAVVLADESAFYEQRGYMERAAECYHQAKKTPALQQNATRVPI